MPMLRTRSSPPSPKRRAMCKAPPPELNATMPRYDDEYVKRYREMNGATYVTRMRMDEAPPIMKAAPPPPIMKAAPPIMKAAPPPPIMKAAPQSRPSLALSSQPSSPFHDALVRFYWAFSGTAVLRRSGEPLEISCSFAHRWKDVLHIARMYSGMTLRIVQPAMRAESHVLVHCLATRVLYVFVVAAPPPPKAPPPQPPLGLPGWR